MKSALLLTLMFAAVALAQVPSHSVVNGTTIDISDTVLNVPYGQSETRALVSACVPDKPAQMTFTLFDPSGENLFYVTLSDSVKTETAYCVTVLAPSTKANIARIRVDVARSSEISSAIGGNKGSGSGAQARRPN